MALLLSACGEAENPTGTPELTAAQSYDDYALYYLGTSFNGLPLTHAAMGPGSGIHRRRAWDFIYGDCTPSGGDAPSCTPPLDVQNWSICTRFPARYPGPTPKTTTIDGVETLPAGGGLDVYTGMTTVAIFGDHRSQVIRSLRPVNDEVGRGKLPPPVPGSLEGKLPCQQHALQRSR